MDRILFIVPPNISFDSYTHPTFNERIVAKKTGNYGSVVSDIPLGALSMSSFLKKHTKADVKLIDFNVVLNKMDSFEFNSFSDLYHSFISSKKWVDYAPNIIGISALFTSSYYNMLDVARISRHIFPNALILAGGGVPTNMYVEIFRDSVCFDAVCYGEGEKPLLGLTEANDKKGFLKNHLSWITREKVENKKFKLDFIENLDEIPFLDFDI